MHAVFRDNNGQQTLFLGFIDNQWEQMFHTAASQLDWHDPNHKMQSGNGWLAPPLRTVFPGIPLSDRSRDSWENWTPGEGKRQRETFTLSEVGFYLFFCLFVFFSKLADLWTNLQQKNIYIFLNICIYTCMHSFTVTEWVCKWWEAELQLILPSVPSYSASSQTISWPEMQHCTMGHRERLQTSASLHSPNTSNKTKI